jgi:hypothetical protein
MSTKSKTTLRVTYQVPGSEKLTRKVVVTDGRDPMDQVREILGATHGCRPGHIELLATRGLQAKPKPVEAKSTVQQQAKPKVAPTAPATGAKPATTKATTPAPQRQPQQQAKPQQTQTKPPEKK